MSRRMERARAYETALFAGDRDGVWNVFDEGMVSLVEGPPRLVK